MKKFILRLLFFLVLVTSVQYIFFSFFPQIPDNIGILTTIEKDGTQIVYFGDSTLTSYSKNDADTRPTFQLLQNLLPNYYVRAIYHDGYQLEVYKDFAADILKNGKNIQYIIIPINMRLLSGSQDDTPWLQFTEDRLYAKYKNTPEYPFLPFLISFRAFDINPVVHEPYDQTPVFNGKKTSVAIYENETYAETNRRKAIYYYMYDIHKNSRKIQAMQEIAQMFQHSNTKVIFYITPIDYQGGEKYAGKGFDKELRNNVNQLITMVKPYHTTVVDMSFALPTTDFVWYNDHYNLDEHPAQKGKEYIARQLANTIQSLSKQK